MFMIFRTSTKNCRHFNSMTDILKSPDHIHSPFLCMMTLINTILPGAPVLQSDGKMLGIQPAKNESGLYAINAIKVGNRDDSWPIVLGIPCTPDVCCLQVQIPVHKALLDNLFLIVLRIKISGGCNSNISVEY